MTRELDLVIIGSGPAGWTSAMYAARAGLKPVVITGFSIGGQLTTTTDVENWPADVDGVQGPELMVRFQNHAEKFGTEIINDEIISVDFSVRPYKISSANGNDYLCKTIIICTGANAKYLGIPSEQKYMGKGVSGCATCDGFFYKNQEVAVVGGGNTAVEEALYLSNIASKVHLIHRRNEFKAEKIMIDRLLKKVEEGKIVLHTDSITDEILGDKSGVNSIRIKHKDTEALTTINLQGVFIAIGHSPNTEIFKEYITLDKGGFIITKTNPHKITETNIPGIFAAGDVQDSIYRQAITSAASGCQAALDAQRFLEENN